jgi:anti-repressor protein
MNELQIFKNPEFGEVRTLTINGNPWFVGKDIAEDLGYQNGSRDINRHVDEEDRRKEMISDGNQLKETIIINESGVYSLILSSKLPTAKKFKHWVTSEVLPAIRKHGGYLTPETVEEALLNPDTLIRLATELKEERSKRQQAEQQIEIDRPKVIFAGAVSASKTSILIGDLAKILKQNGYETGQQRLFKQLRDEGYLMKSGSSRNMPTQKAMQLGLFEVKETTISNPDGSIRTTKTPKVTGKGQIYFINRYIKADDQEAGH